MSIYTYQGLTPVVDATTFVHPQATLIGDVIIGGGCYIAPGAVLRGDMGRLVVEAGSNIQDNCTLHGAPNQDLVIGENGHIGHGAVVHGCHCERDVLVGMNAVVMDGAVVGRNSVVAAMAFVRVGMQIPPRSMVMGTPGRIVREITDAEVADKVIQTRAYQRLTRHCLLGRLVPAEPLPAPEPNRPRLDLTYLIADKDPLE